MSALGDARARLASALSPTAVGVHVHSLPPDTIAAPCVVFIPGSPWLDARGHATFDLVLMVNAANGNRAALTQLEDLVDSMRAALWAAGLPAGDTTPPIPEETAGVLSCTTPVTFRIC